jgi:hypothetical protein
MAIMPIAGFGVRPWWTLSNAAPPLTAFLQCWRSVGAFNRSSHCPRANDFQLPILAKACFSFGWVHELSLDDQIVKGLSSA